MIKKISIVSFLSLLFGYGAGQNILKCYSRINSDQSRIEAAIRKVWQKYPENRVTYYDVIKLTTNNSNRINIFETDSSKGDFGYFIHESIFLNKQLKTWRLKSMDSRFIFKISIANCNDKNENCSICLDGIIRTKELKGWENWDLPISQKKEAKRVFMEDILKKIQNEL